MALPPLADVSQLSTSLGYLVPEDDTARAEDALVRVSSLVRSEAGRTWEGEEPPDAVVTIVLEVAKRVFVNPLNVRTSTMGPANASFAMVGLYLSPDEARTIRRAVGRRSGLHTVSFARGDLSGSSTVYVPTAPPPPGYPFPFLDSEDA